jgi:hypothetical protein
MFLMIDSLSRLKPLVGMGGAQAMAVWPVMVALQLLVLCLVFR